MLIDELKNECERKRLEVEKQYKSVCEDIIMRDVHNCFPDIKMQDGKYWISDQISMSIINGNFEIEDCRGTQYLWIFEISSNIVSSDYFHHEERLYRVRDITDEKLIPQVHEVIQRLDNYLVQLNQNDTLSYKYYCSSEDIEANSIEDVLKRVLARKPVIR